MNISFDNFIGNTSAKTALKVAFSQNRVPQAIILQGEKGTGKKTFAKQIAQIAVCKNENKACGVCPACIRAKAGSHPDIRIEEGSGVSGNISVETIRSIIDDAQRKPDEADYNIFLIFVKNTISPASQNKLLKVIEEPPGNALFIITITSAESLLPTIRSRANCFTLYPPSIEESAKFVSENFEKDYDESLSLSKLFKGNIGSMLDGNSLPVELAIKTSHIFDLNNIDSFLAVTANFIKNRDFFCLYLENLRLIFRDALIISENTHDFLGVSHSQSQRISQKYQKLQIMQLCDVCTNYINLTRRNANMTLLVTAFCSKLRFIISH